jgi:hypothetical protein
VKTIIHVDQAVIRRNRKLGTNEPPVIVRNYKGSRRVQTAEILGPATICHSPHKPLPCGARVWIETQSEVKCSD